MATTDVGKERWTAWEIIDAVFPYDVNAYVRAFNKRGIVLLWSRLPGRQLVELLLNKLTRVHRLVKFDDASPTRIRDIVASARRVLGGLKEVKVESRVRGDYLRVSENELSNIVMDSLKLIGGDRTLIIEVVWDVAGLSLIEDQCRT